MPLGETGLFVKAGAVIPMFQGLTHIKKSELDTLHLYIAPGEEKGVYVHYEDDGETLDYRNGGYNEYEFTKEQGMLNIRTLHNGYETTYRTLVIHVDVREITVPFTGEGNISLN